MVAQKRLTTIDAVEAVRKAARTERGPGGYHCPQKKCGEKCGDKATFKTHLENHPDFLHGPVTREGYLCTACPKAYQKDSRGTNDAAIHQAGHERAGIDSGLIFTYVDFYWLGTPGQGRYHFYGLRSSKPRVKGEWYQSLVTPKRKKSEALVANSPHPPLQKEV